MKNKYRILKILVTVGILIFLLHFSLKRFANSPLQGISVKMIQNTPVYFIDEKDIKDIIKKNYSTKRIGDLDVPSLEKDLKQNLSALDSINVYLGLDGVLNIDVKQRIPVLRINNNGNLYYVDQKGIQFPLSNKYSHHCILVSGKISKEDYPKLIRLAKKIEKDEFFNQFFAGIKKEKEDYFLLTDSGDYKVELGDLENIDFKLKGFKTFLEKYLVHQNPQKYKKISLKYNNQIVTTLNRPYSSTENAENDPEKSKTEEVSSDKVEKIQ